MTITAVTPPDAASDPKHPDHERWVKEHTFRMEVEHAKLLGLPLRVAEENNRRMLERSEKLARETAIRPVADKSAKREQRHAARGVTKNAPKKQRQAKGCVCGQCVLCKRTMRVLAIIERKRTGDVSALGLWNDLTSASLSASAGIGRFKGLSPFDTKRALVAAIDSICDRSVALMGAWR